ncbi:hypothetical protein ACS0TY_030803 [Phlomoides rotata]
MANHPRKILFEDNKEFSSDCYMCYACPQHCYISPPPPELLPEPDPRKSHVSTVLIFMLCILGLAFLLLSYLTMVKNRLRNSTRRSPEPLQNSMADFLDENQGPVLDHPIWYIRTVGLPQSVIDSIGSFLYKKGDGLIERNDCSICLSEFQENEMLRLLPKCSHAFHGNCIDVWLRSHKNCPVCRALILIANESSSSRPSEIEVPAQGEVETDESRPIQEDRMAEDLRVFDSRIKRGRVLSDIVDHRVRVDDQELRRSFSMDFSSAPAAEKGGEGCSEMVVKRDCKIYRLIKSASCVQSLRKGPVSMKKSFSFSGKRSRKNNSRSLESIEY